MTRNQAIRESLLLAQYCLMLPNNNDRDRERRFQINKKIEEYENRFDFNLNIEQDRFSYNDEESAIDPEFWKTIKRRNRPDKNGFPFD